MDEFIPGDIQHVFCKIDANCTADRSFFLDQSGDLIACSRRDIEQIELLLIRQCDWPKIAANANRGQTTKTGSPGHMLRQSD